MGVQLEVRGSQDGSRQPPSPATNGQQPEGSFDVAVTGLPAESLGTQTANAGCRLAHTCGHQFLPWPRKYRSPTLDVRN